jgi:hypothetical protein
METHMTSPLRLAVAPAVLAAALFVSALSPVPAFAGPQEQAVAQCRADLLGRFPDGSIQNYRVAEISGNSRGTRVRIIVSADRRYSYECRAGGDGRIISATFDPPRDDRLAAGQR